MRRILVALLLFLGTASAAFAEVRFHIGIDIPAYPVLERVPGYPVYYAPRLRTNYFFYDGLYWVYENDSWYASDWYNGPWYVVDPHEVPVFLLRVPVRYYRDPPVYFRSWRVDAPPRWEAHWGWSWAERRAGWDRWDRRSVPVAAPLPVYQRQYSGARYPTLEQQVVIQERNYRYQPRERVARRVVEERRQVAETRQERLPPGQRRAADRGPPDHAVARGLDRDGDDRRGPPEHARARGHDRDERGIPAHAQGRARGHEGEERGRGRGRDKD